MMHSFIINNQNTCNSHKQQFNLCSPGLQLAQGCLELLEPSVCRILSVFSLRQILFLNSYTRRGRHGKKLSAIITTNGYDSPKWCPKDQITKTPCRINCCFNAVSLKSANQVLHYQFHWVEKLCCFFYFFLASPVCASAPGNSATIWSSHPLWLPLSSVQSWLVYSRREKTIVCADNTTECWLPFVTHYRSRLPELALQILHLRVLLCDCLQEMLVCLRVAGKTRLPFVWHGFKYTLQTRSENQLSLAL